MFVSDMVDQLRDLLNDAGDTQETIALKRLYLNRGISRLWPSVFRVSSSSAAVVAANTYDYALPTAMGNGSLLSVELESGAATGRYYVLEKYEFIEGDAGTAPVLKLLGTLPAATAIIRVRYTNPIPVIVATTYAAMQSETWLGPDVAIGLPVMYAMGMAAMRKVDDRQDTNRYNTNRAMNGTTDVSMMDAAQLWFAQFDAELDRLAAQFVRYMPRGV